MAPLKIFYSWQSDLPNRLNRSFIEDALKRAIRQINRAEDFGSEFVLDRDTQGIPGAPNIAEVILRKIRQSAVFVADVTPVTNRPRRCPNPNVMFETGYALSRLGEGRLITITNTKFGNVRDLPFDLGYRRALTYELGRFDKNKAAVRERLVKGLTTAIDLTLPALAPRPGPGEDKLPDPEFTLERTDSSRERLLPRVALSDAELFWLRLMAREFEGGVRTPPHILTRRHKDKLGLDFDPESVDARLLSQGKNVTLLGLWHVDHETPWLDRSEVVIRYVKQILEAHPEVHTLSVAVVAKKLGMTPREVSTALQLQPRPMWKSAGGNPSGDHYLTLYSHFEVGEERVFRFYEAFESIEQAITQAFNSIDKQGKPVSRPG